MKIPINLNFKSIYNIKKNHLKSKISFPDLLDFYEFFSDYILDGF
jgi:hypothetical protein